VQLNKNSPGAPLYTPAQRRRRDRTRWTLVQGVLAPLQFLACAISLVLVLRCLATGRGLLAAQVSVLVKTALLYAIMVTGSLWERAVFGRWLFAGPFFWEDVVSMLVIALHTAYVAALIGDFLSPRAQLQLALAAYASYAINAAQFLHKFSAARRSAPTASSAAVRLRGAAACT
jgi:3-vinyl bacteriochlorophyllide hydratase